MVSQPSLTYKQAPKTRGKGVDQHQPNLKPRVMTGYLETSANNLMFQKNPWSLTEGS